MSMLQIKGVRIMGCKGICQVLKKVKYPRNKKLPSNFKYCSTCAIALETELIRCDCCRYLLRHTPRNRRKTRVAEAFRH